MSVSNLEAKTGPILPLGQFGTHLRGQNTKATEAAAGGTNNSKPHLSMGVVANGGFGLLPFGFQLDVNMIEKCLSLMTKVSHLWSR